MRISSWIGELRSLGSAVAASGEDFSARLARKAVMTMGVLATSVLLAGCGGAAGVDGLVPASGTVTYQGQPVEGATVIFSPQGAGRASSSITDADGRFQLTTLTAGDGVMPGSYRVAVTKTEAVGGGTGEEEPGASAELPEVTVKNLLPEKYKSPEISGLAAEVTASGENVFSFELTD